MGAAAGGMPGTGVPGAQGPGIYGGGAYPQQMGPVAPPALAAMYPTGAMAGRGPVIGDPRGMPFGGGGPSGIRTTLPGPLPLPPVQSGPVLPGPRAPFQFVGPAWFQRIQASGGPNPQQTQQIINNIGLLNHMQHQQMKAYNAGMVAPGVPRMLAAQAGVIGSGGGGGGGFGNFAVSPRLGGGGFGGGQQGGQQGGGFGGPYGWGGGLDANSMNIQSGWNYDAQGYPYAQSVYPDTSGGAYMGSDSGMGYIAGGGNLDAGGIGSAGTTEIASAIW